MTTPRWVLVVVLALACAVSTGGCGLHSSSGIVLKAQPGSIGYDDSLSGVRITVAAKSGTEQRILGNMLSTILATVGADVTNLSNTPGSFGVREAMLAGTATVSPDYTGTAWIEYLGHQDPIKDERRQWAAVNDADRANHLTWLPPAPLNNSYAFAVRESEVQRLGIDALSGLGRLAKAELTFCVDDEFASRNDGFVPMLHTYGLTRSDLGRVITLDAGMIYSAVANGDCNFGEVYTTDGRIPALKLRVLADDKHYFPLYNLSEVVNTGLLAAHPELAEIFAKLNPRLTNTTMQALNAKVDDDGEDPAQVARAWLIQQGLLT